MRIIPAIDIIEGKCVRLTKGDFATKKIYNENPLDVAKSFEDAGIQHLHLVDLDGARAGKIVNYKLIEEIANNTKLLIDFGGGLKSNEDLEIAFSSGAHQITAGSIAASNPTLTVEWIERFGKDRIIIGADTLDGKIAVNGWQETSDDTILEFIKTYLLNGADTFISTDVNKDGMMNGPAFELYGDVLNRFEGIKLVASGGISSIDDLLKLGEMKLDGAIIGKAIYEGAIDLKALSELC